MPLTWQYGTFSPDGRWLAYASNETGRPEAYVEAFPGPADRYEVSADGGEEPLWARGSEEIRAVRTRTGPRADGPVASPARQGSHHP